MDSPPSGLATGAAPEQNVVLSVLRTKIWLDISFSLRNTSGA